MTRYVCAAIAELDILLKIKKTFYRKGEKSIFKGQNLESISKPGEQHITGFTWNH